MDNPQAYPNNGQCFNHDGSSYPVYNRGMTLRDYFAGQFLTTFLVGKTDDYFNEEEVDDKKQLITKACYELADAMLKERSKDGTN